jgi:antiviral defense system Shedu protein SduA
MRKRAVFDMNDKEKKFISGARLDHLYTHPFRNEGGKYFSVITTEDGDTAIEYEQPKSKRNRLKMRLTFIKSDNDITSVEFKKFKLYKADGWQEQYFGPDEPFTLTHFSFEKLASFLNILSELDLASVNEHHIALVEANAKGISAEDERKLRTLLIQPDGQKIVESLIQNGLITSRDIVNIGFRKEQLRKFERLLKDPKYSEEYASECGIPGGQREKIWQFFLRQNDWLFGFGLDYRYLGILQSEAHLGTEDVAGRDGAIGDFLMGASNFTVLVEVKRPDTELFAKGKNRANSWRLSRELIDAVSQILEQKASWQIKAETNAIKNYAQGDDLISQKTVDPKCFLIIGSLNSIAGSDREKEIKLRTFELFRRDSRNIEIITYDELYERAVFIVGSGDQSAKMTGNP